MTRRKVTTWTLEFDRLEVIQLRELAATMQRFTQPTLKACLASVTFANPRLTLDYASRNDLRALVQNGPTESTDIRFRIWEALA